MSKKRSKQVRKRSKSPDLGDSSARATLARASRFPLESPMEITYADLRWKVSREKSVPPAGTASFVLAE